MPRYYFDIDDGERQSHDVDGIDLPSSGDVETTTRDLLFDLGHAEILKGEDRMFGAVVRDEHGVTVYRGSMVLRIIRET